ncbi:MFS transporter [Arhodomonas sp. SL1]|uniref:MFS transporter n=1 Tax=Arhodomonas sp. SL1 TaxID=3425691 RepID=UPI003F882B9E
MGSSSKRHTTGPMSGPERRATAGLAGIFGLRMLGLFLIMPVFTLYADELAGATPLLIGLAIGAYGLTQALLQIPMGVLSDRWGRRPVILAGLAVFAVGSVVAALSTGIWGVIGGRALQGAGAIAAAVMALAADNTREQQRTKSMAIIGISVGLAFMLALIVAPAVAGAFGLSGVFWLTAALAALAVVLLLAVVPRPAGRSHDRDIRPGSVRAVLRDRDLLRLDASVLLLHLIMTAQFVVLPVVISEAAGLAPAAHWRLYVPVMVVSALLMFPAIGVGEAKRVMHRLVLVAVAVLIAGEVALADMGLVGPWPLAAALVVYFTAFNVLEASLPSLVSRFAPEAARGAALGVFSTAQFAGAFLGGVIGGAVYGSHGPEGVFLTCAGVGVLWLVLARGLRPPAVAGAAQGEGV